MRTNGEIAHDAQMVATLRRCADALDAIAGTLAVINEKLAPPVYITPREAIDAVVANPKMASGPVIGDNIADNQTQEDPGHE
jgi:hypothetical protein